MGKIFCVESQKERIDIRHKIFVNALKNVYFTQMWTCKSTLNLSW